MIRFVIMVDVDEDDLDRAYKCLYESMTAAALDWESTDEAYDPDGEPYPEDTLSDVRIRSTEARTRQGASR